MCMEDVRLGRTTRTRSFMVRPATGAAVLVIPASQNRVHLKITLSFTGTGNFCLVPGKAPALVTGPFDPDACVYMQNIANATWVQVIDYDIKDDGDIVVQPFSSFADISIVGIAVTETLLNSY